MGTNEGNYGNKHTSRVALSKRIKKNLGISYNLKNTDAYIETTLQFYKGTNYRCDRRVTMVTRQWSEVPLYGISCKMLGHAYSLSNVGLNCFVHDSSAGFITICS